MGDVDPARLAEIVPQNWRETRRRVEVARRFLADVDQSTAALQRHADELGVGRAVFYKLLSMVAAWDRQPDLGALPMRRRLADAPSVAVRDAIVEKGGDAQPERIWERAVELADERGVSRPSRTRVRSMLGRSGVGDCLAKRLGLKGDLVADACPMAVRLGSERAVLLAILDVRTGAPIAWRVVAGAPTANDFDELAGEVAGGGAEKMVLNVGTALADVPFGAAFEARFERVDRGRPAPGSAVRAALGAAIGRIRLLPRTKAVDASVPEVDAADLDSVIGEMLGLPAR